MFSYISFSEALQAVIENAAAGKTALELCELGDKVIRDNLKTVYTKGKVDKGIGFPTSIAVNNW